MPTNSCEIIMLQSMCFVIAGITLLNSKDHQRFAWRCMKAVGYESLNVRRQ